MISVNQLHERYAKKVIIFIIISGFGLFQDMTVFSQV